MSNVTNVFVYGSLLPGLQNSFLLDGSSAVGAGKTTGLLFSMGAFPAVVLNKYLTEPTDATIKGMVYQVSPEVLADLDALEGYVEGMRGNLYDRDTVSVQMETGNVIEALIYNASPRIINMILSNQLPYVENGDWMAWAVRYVTPHLDKVLEI